MYCSNCQISGQSGSFCSKCGNALVAEPVAQATSLAPKSKNGLLKLSTIIPATVALVALVAAVVLGTQFASANDQLNKLKAREKSAQSEVAARVELLSKALSDCNIGVGTSGFKQLDKAHVTLSDTNSSDVTYDDTKCVLQKLNAPTNVMDAFIQVGYSDGGEIKTFDGFGVAFSWDEVIGHPNAGYLYIWVEGSADSVATGTV